MDKKIIWSIADLVRDKLNLSVPLNLDKLIEAIEYMGGKCVPQNGFGIDATITTKEGNNTFEIVYLANRPKTRILFSISHELGHLFLHMIDGEGKIVSGQFNRTNITSEEEVQANEFAAALLMPEEIFVEKCIENGKDNDGNVDVSKIAAFFNVSIQAATVRGRVLGLWN